MDLGGPEEIASELCEQINLRHALTMTLSYRAWIITLAGATVLLEKLCSLYVGRDRSEVWPPAVTRWVETPLA